MSKHRIAAASFLIIISLPGCPPTAGAYELRTHREITQRAFDASTEVAAYLDAAGIKADDAFDPGSATPEKQLDFFQNAGTPRDWLIEGAIREDDFVPAPDSQRCPGPENPETGISRVLNHFFDVQRFGLGINLGGLIPVPGSLPAPDWALGQQGRGPGAGRWLIEEM